MNRKVFNDGFAALVAAFPLSDRSTGEQQEIYWLILKEIPDDIFTAGIKKCLSESTFFPTIHDIGVACLGEQKEEWADKCDPWRAKQNYRERIAPESWQDRLMKITALPAIEGPRQAALEAPEVRVVMRACDHEKEINELRAEVFTLRRENEDLKTRPRMTIDERKALLKDQARVLAADSAAEKAAKRQKKGAA